MKFSQKKWGGVEWGVVHFWQIAFWANKQEFSLKGVESCSHLGRHLLTVWAFRQQLVQWNILSQDNRISCVSCKTNNKTNLCILSHLSGWFVKYASTQMKTASVMPRQYYKVNVVGIWSTRSHWWSSGRYGDLWLMWGCALGQTKRWLSTG